MGDQYPLHDRASLLADVAEMYYLEEKSQAEIARAVGATRSNVSRMLKEAREKRIVEIHVNRPLQSEYDLENTLSERFQLQGAFIVHTHRSSADANLNMVGAAGALVLKRHLKAGTILGISWGTSVSATVNALEVEEPIPVKIVQLVGALGARNTDYDGHALVARLAEKLGGEGYYLNAPFLCPNPEMVSALLEAQGVRETISLGRRAEVVLMGIGSTAPKLSSYYLAGYMPFPELKQLTQAGAVGDACGLHFDITGKSICHELCDRFITINEADLKGIPLRIGVAAGLGKAETILGALRGEFVNYLVTDGDTARLVLDLADRK